MKLHRNTSLKRIVRSVSPWLSRMIIWLQLTVVVRHAITSLNFLIGRGSGSGWDLKEEVNTAVRLIQRKAPIVFDVGGNIGAWSDLFRQQILNGELYIFEPQAACQEIIRSKNITNSHLVAAAVGEKNERLMLYSSHSTDASASLHKRDDSFFQHRHYDQQEVDVIALDNLIEKEGIAFVDYIKFDIEGNEFAALQGLQNALSERRIGAFSFEFGSGNLNSRTCFRDFWKLLNADYELCIVTPSGHLAQIDSYYEDLEFYRGVSNFVAKLREQVESGPRD